MRLAPSLALFSFAAASGACRAPDHTSLAENPTAPAEISEAAGAATSLVADEALLRARSEFEDARAAKQRGDHTTAREKARVAIETLLSTEPQSDSEARIATLDEIAKFAHDAGELKTAEQGKRRVVEFDTRTLPPDHFDLQKARGSLATTIAALGDLRGARALREQVLEAFARTLPEDHRDLQWARVNMGASLYAAGELASARRLYEQAVEVLARTRPEDDALLLAARTSLASTTYMLGDPASARAQFEKAFEVQARTLPDDHPALQTLRLNLASTAYALGDAAGSKRLLEKVLEVYARTLPEGHDDVQYARQNLALALSQLGELARAQELLAGVVEVRARTLPADHPDLQLARESLAAMMLQLGDVPGARTLLERVIEVYARTLPDDHPHLQQARNNLAAALSALGDFEGARALEEKVLDVRSRTLPADHRDLLSARSNFASTLRSLGDLARARSIEAEVLEILARKLPDEHPHLQVARLNLAWTLALQRDFQGARALEEKVLEVRIRTLPDEHPDLQGVRVNLGNTRRSCGDRAGALELKEKALEVWTRTLPEDHPNLQIARASLLPTLVEQAGLATEGQRRAAWERCLSLVGSITASSIRIARVATLESSSREAEARCSSLASSLSTSISYALGLGAYEHDPGLTRTAFVLSETVRGSALASARLARLARADEHYADLRTEIRSASEELGRFARAGGTRDSYDAVIARRDRAQRELVSRASRSDGSAGLPIDLDPATLSACLPEDHALVAYRRYARAEIVPKNDAPPAEVESLCAFVLRTGGELDCVQLGPLEPIARAVRAWRAGLGVAGGRGVGVGGSTSPTSDAPLAAARIRGLVFDPLLPRLSGARRLVVLLDDVLQSVPLDALPAGAPTSAADELLGDRYAFEFRATAQELLAAGRPAKVAGLALLLGGADYSAEPSIYVADPVDRSAAGESTAAATRAAVVASLLRGGAWEAGFGPLPGTLAEVRGLENLARQAGEPRELVRLEAGMASRASIEILVPGARFLHLATHGWFAPESVRSWNDPDPVDAHGAVLALSSASERVKGSSPMLLCGLALAGANLPADAVGRHPGLVTAEEVAGWELSSCELAVLSACDTNVGERKAGQGVDSLQKALHMAGARSVITSLWKVPDEATKELMLDFYGRLWLENKPKAQALWEAKRRLREARDERGVPRYAVQDWAGWVLTGESE